MSPSPHTSSQSSEPRHWPLLSARIVQGQMAADFLQGYLTCDTATLNSASLQPMAICNIKGRVVASGWACTLAEAEGVALVVHHSLQARIGEFLLPYVRFSKCELDARAWSLTVVENGLTYGAEHQLALTLEPGQPLQPADQRQLKYSLIEQGFALTSSATSEQFLPQMLNLEHTGAINFDKGCYLGQEIVARAQFRGAIKRGLSRFNWQGDCPQPGGTWQEGVVIDAVADAADENRGIGHAVVAR